jgi:hypothetical protein
MSLPRLVFVLLLAVASAGVPARGRAVVDLAANGPCSFKLSFNLQFFGPGADSAFAALAIDDILECWSGKQIGCCPVDVCVNAIVGGDSAVAGYDSIYVFDDLDSPRGRRPCRASVGTLNGTQDGHGIWSNHAHPNTFAHEVGHLAGLEDAYKVVSGEIVCVWGKEIDTRVTKPCEGYEYDKMATLSGKVDARIMNALAAAAQLSCSLQCWDDDVPGGDASGSIEILSLPVPRPSTGKTTILVSLTEDQFTYVFFEAQQHGGGLQFANMNGSFQIRTDDIPDPYTNPLADQEVASIRFVDVAFDIDPFLWEPGQSTGQNWLTEVPVELVALDLIAPSVGTLVDKPGGSAPGVRTAAATDPDGTFEGILGLQLVNDLFPASAPAFIETPVFGQIDYETGTGFFGMPLSPFFFANLVAVPDPTGGEPAVLLGRNHPNPFAASTHISFRLDAAGPVSLRVFDLSGRRVATLVDASAPAGTYSLLWDGTDSSGRAVAPGVYFARLRAGSAVQTRRMVKAP